MGSPIASNHWETTLGDHCRTISTIHLVSADVALLDIDAPPIQESTDAIRAPPSLPEAEDPILEKIKLPEPPGLVFVFSCWLCCRPNLGTLNHELRRPDS